MSEARARVLVRRRSGGMCELCDVVAGQWHHRKNRSQGGRWEPSNGLHVCGECHQWVTEHPLSAYRHGWSVPSWAEPADVPVLLHRGRVWRYLDTSGAEVST